MQRNDTTARKWNSSRPTYDEDWSDEEPADEIPAGISRLTITQQPIAKAPWEIEVDDESPGEGATQTYKTLDQSESGASSQSESTGADQNTSGSIKRVYSLHDRPVRPKTPEDVPHTLESGSSMKRSSARRSLLPEDLSNQESIVGHLQPGSPVDTAHRTNALPDNTATLPSIISISNSVQADSPLSESPSPIDLASMHDDADSDAFVDEDENLRLEALMFNPENLDINRYSDDEQDTANPSEEELESTDDHEAIKEDARTQPATISQERPQPSDVPDFPQDFREGLKSRALSDAILETYHAPTTSVEMQRSLSEDKPEVHNAVIAERTPSIMLTTTAWAEKSRLLKEQLEKNKRLKEELQKRPLVRESTYDHEYDYQAPIARILSPMRDMEISNDFSEPTCAVTDSNYYEAQPVPVHPNLNTLLEEEEDEEPVRASKSSQYRNSPIQRPFTPQTQLFETAATDTPEASVASKRREIPAPSKSPTRVPTLGTIESTRPESAKSYDTYKELPVIAPNLSSHDSEHSASGSDGESSVEDDTLSPEQEYAMLKSLEAEIMKSTPAIAKDKDLPPLLQDSPKSRTTDLPTIRTSLDHKLNAPNLVQARAEYTPSEYSALPSASSPTHSNAIPHSNLLPSLPVSDSPPQLAPVQETEDPQPRPTSKVWEPLRANAKVPSQASPPKIETSRFSSSTIQSLEPDDYQFDMRDSFNPAMYSTLQDKPYYSDDEVDSNTSGRLLNVPDQEREHSLRSSASVATLQPALRHMQSTLTINADSSSAPERESERLADELLQELSMAHAPKEKGAFSELAREAIETDSQSIALHRSPAVEPDTSHGTLSSEHDEIAPNAIFGARGRSASAGSKFLEVMSPMTSMEQTRATEDVVPNSASCQAQSADLLRYKDIKQLPTSQLRTAEYRRRTKALQDNSSGLKEYLSAIELHFKQENRSLPGPAPRTEFKSNKTIIPDIFVPGDLSRTTARIGDKGKDAAKELLSKSTRGLKGLFHSNSRSVSGSKKPNISLPLESKKQDRRVSLFGTRSASGQEIPTMSTAPHYQQSLMPPMTPQSPQNNQHYSPIHNQVPHQQPAMLASPISQRSHKSPFASGRELVSPLPDSPDSNDNRCSGGRPTSTIARIKTYFPDLTDRDVEEALIACDLDEQRAIGYLVVHRQGR